MNLPDAVLELYRCPTASTLSRFGWDYAETQVLRRGEAVMPLAAPGSRVAVDDLLP